MSESYNKNEIQLMMKNFDDKIGKVTKSQDEILELLRTMEDRLKSLEMWRAYLTGAVAVLLLLGIPEVLQMLSAT